jgi:hypothetical protein
MFKHDRIAICPGRAKNMPRRYPFLPSRLEAVFGQVLFDVRDRTMWSGKGLLATMSCGELDCSVRDGSRQNSRKRIPWNVSADARFPVSTAYQLDQCFPMLFCGFWHLNEPPGTGNEMARESRSDETGCIEE